MNWGYLNAFRTDTLPNLYLWNSLGPYGYTTSYGRGVQFNTLPFTYTPQEAIAFHNATNPYFHVAQMFQNLHLRL